MTRPQRQPFPHFATSLAAFFAAFLVCMLCAAALAQAPLAAENPPADTAEAKGKASGLRYTVDISVSSPASNSPVQNNAAASLVDETKTNSQLLWLREDLPDGNVALERRVLADVDTARKILRSQGYYQGNVRYKIHWDTQPVRIDIELVPGARASIGTTRIVYLNESENGSPETARAETRNPASASAFASAFADPKLFPPSLADFGLKKGEPAQAAAVLAAVQRVSAHLERTGYPLSRIVKTEYLYIESTQSLDATVTVATGPFLRMGHVRIEGASGVSESYLDSLAPWQIGEPWDARSIEAYRTALQETGLFNDITIKPGPHAEKAGSKADTPVLLSVTEAPARTISGGLRYSTDKGFGVNGTWENRNLFGNGERLRVTAPIDQDLQMLSASFRKPSFGDREQALVGEAEARNENTDAYDQTAGYLAAGLERRFGGEWRHWWASARVSVEGGTLSDHLKGKREYALVGLPLSLRRDTTNDLFNPSQGTRLALTLTPYTGMYDGALTTLRSRLDGSAYYKVTDSDFLVLAARAAVGSLTGESVQNIPASLRFYVGGGGSVRGYKYQSIGPENADGNPIGGLSFTDISFESRFKITESFGLVPFIDGGMVYDSALPKFGKDMYWGAGLGFRYYTAIGPIRLDVAVPLQDRENNKAFQIYLSLGQAF